MIRLVILVLIFHSKLCAQDPPGEPSGQGRIVEGRPRLYTIKRAIHPLTWIEITAEPVFRSTENGLIRKLLSRKLNPHVELTITGDGAGSGFGPQLTLLHRNLFGRGIEIELPLLHTYAKYETFAAKVKAPLASGRFTERLTLDFRTAYRSRARDDFYGIGNESRLEDESEFRAVIREVDSGLSAKFDDAWSSSLRVGYRNTGITKPQFGHSAQDSFRSAAVPGLFTGAAMYSTALSLDHDSRDKDYPMAAGGVERFEASLNEGLGRGDFSYWKYRLEAFRFFPLTDDRRKVIALRGRFETNQEKGGSGIPFFDMPVLGNWATVRGFKNYRFYDKSAMSLGAEYRYRIWRPADFAFFVDAGQVAPEPGDFGINRFHAGYGIRLITMPKRNFPVTFDLGRSSEKWHAYVNFNSIF